MPSPATPLIRNGKLVGPPIDPDKANKLSTDQKVRLDEILRKNAEGTRLTGEDARALIDMRKAVA